MKFNQVIAALTLVGNTVAFRTQQHHKIMKRQSSDVYAYPVVPSYNMSMPVDHFTSSDTRTYDQRFFVNDTYYQPGGPVIVNDFGESGISGSLAASYLAEFNGTISSSLRLAERLNGLVIGWEHRYYGYSQPVAITVDPTDPNDTYTGGLPTQGASGYKYLTVEQAIEDLAYFANNFNKTTLSLNTVVTNTANLDPYHVPWIIMGASYPGVRSAWARIRHPEVFYAAWSSSAPVEAREDGSIYYNPIYRALPANCTADIQAAVGYLDKAIKANSASLYGDEVGIYLGQNSASALPVDISSVQSWTSYDPGNVMSSALTGEYQSWGPAHTTQVFCNYMNEFDVQTFFESAASSSSDPTIYWETVFNTSLVADPRANGIAATFGTDGPLAAFLAYQYASYWLQNYELSQDALYYGESDGYDRDMVDTHSWNWQTLAQMGFFQGSNVSSKYNLVSQYANVTATEDAVYGLFPDYSTSDFPASVNTTGPLSFGGWKMTPSNVMFTNGEFDPWRAFGVQSQEQTDAGAPQRTLTQTVPACNKPPSGSDVFGLVYAGAVHGEDMVQLDRPQGSEDFSDLPWKQGLELFVSAYNAWTPCFNQSRDDIRNGKGVDGSGNNASGGKTNSASSNNTGRFGGLSVITALTVLCYVLLS